MHIESTVETCPSFPCSGFKEDMQLSQLEMDIWRLLRAEVNAANALKISRPNCLHMMSLGIGIHYIEVISYNSTMVLYLDDFARMGCLATSVKLQLEFWWRISSACGCFFPTALGMLAESTKKQDFFIRIAELNKNTIKTWTVDCIFSWLSNSWIYTSSFRMLWEYSPWFFAPHLVHLFFC